jgi:hypothetical protein
LLLVVVANDAEEHLRVLRRLMPGARFVIVFDPALERQDLSDEGSRANFRDYCPDVVIIFQ